MNNKTLVIGEQSIELDYEIRKQIEFEKQIVVLIYDKTIIANNIISFDKKGKELWKVNDILKIIRPTGNVDMEKVDETTLLVHSSLGIKYKIDIEKKILLEKLFSR